MKIFKKFICNLHKFAKSSYEMSLLLSSRGGGPIDVRLQGENYHKISLIGGESLLLIEDVVPLFCNL